MPYPTDNDIEVTLEAAFGADVTAAPSTWTFTDLSSRVIQNAITISQGVVVGNTTKTASASGILCTNDDGWLTPFLETSPYWPNVDAGTPARLSIRTDTSLWLSDTFARTVAAGGWGTATDGHIWLGINPAMSVNGSTAQFAVTAVNSPVQNRTAIDHYDIDVTWDMSIAAVSTGAANVVGPMLRWVTTSYLWPTVELGLSGAVTVNLRKTVTGTVTSVASATQPGLTYAAGTVIRCRAVVVGDRLKAKAWLAAGTPPSRWTVEVSVTDPVLLTAGTLVGMRTQANTGNTNTLPNPISVDNLVMQQPRYARIEGYLTGVQPSFWVDSQNVAHSRVAISIGGITSRLEKLAADELSPLRRSLEKASVPPIAYWPCEDKSASTSAASAFAGLDPLAVTGPAVFEFGSGSTSSAQLSTNGTTALVSLAAGAKLSGSVPVSASTSWSVSMEHQSFVRNIGGGVTSVRLLEWATPGGTFNRWALIGTLTGHVVRAYNDSAGTTTDVITFASGFNVMFHYSVTANQNGGNIDVQLFFAGGLQATGSVAGTNRALNRVAANPDQQNTTASTDPFGIRMLFGHITVHDSVIVVLPFYNDPFTGLQSVAESGWGFDAAHHRASRLAGEERVPLRVLGDPYTTGVTLLNVQQPGAFRTLINDAVDSESGSLLVEGEFGYLLDPRTNRYNRAVTLAVNMTTYCRTSGLDPLDVLVPKLDARGPNLWTVERHNGSSATYAASTAFRQRRGTIGDKAELDVLLDSDTGPHAQWRVHLNVDGQGANYPATVIDLAANPTLIGDYLQCRVGSRVQRTNQPTIAGLGTVDQVIDGMTETIVPRQAGGPSWTATLDTSPADVWDTGIWDSASSLWQPGNTVLSSGVNTTATSWSMNSNGEPWITGAVSIRAKLGPEQVLITNITGAGSAWTFTVTRSVNSVVASHTAGAEKIVLLDAGTWAL